MIVEIHGAGFLNKGAQLMLLTAATRLRQAGATRIGIERLPKHPDEGLRAYDLEPMFPSVRPVRIARPFSVMYVVSRVAGRLVPHRPGRLTRQEPDAFIDISGYAFGDRWGRRRVENVARRAAYYRKKGKPAILLPQMLGPFEQPGVAAGFKKLVRECDRVYARDRLSLDAARAVVGDVSALRRAPDITIFAPGVDDVTPIDDGSTPFGCLVPNQRMLDSGKDQATWRRVYLDKLTAAGKAMAEAGLAVRVLVHDTGGEDLPLARQIAAALPGARILEHDDPLVLKATLGSARLVVGSRFHALVAALSRGVPSIALGWGHKYEMLLEDFGTPDLIHGAQAATDGLLAQIAELVDEDANEARRVTLRERRDALRDAHDVMWRDVCAVLGLDGERALD
jgi:polysaccharide pyruvyl transferase WcaK-like protein